MLIVLIAAMAVLSPFFLSFSNFLNILLATSTIGVLAIGATYVIGSGGIDLSLGSVMGLSGVVGAHVAVKLGAAAADRPRSPASSPAPPRATSTACSSPAPTCRPSSSPSACSAWRAVWRWSSPDGRSIYGLPPMMVYVGQGRPLGIPMPVIIFLVAAVVAHCVLAYTHFGRHTLAIGDNESAARAAGIRVERHRRILYTLSGALAGLAGMLFMARVNSGDPTSGLNYELTAITAAIIGGTNLFGGRASILGTMIGALIMGVLQNGLNLLAVQSYYQQMAIGAVLILAVFIDQYQLRKESRV